jgi:hypothetical protein
LEGKGLRELTKNKNNPVFRQLSKSFKEAFLLMTPQDEETLKKHKQIYTAKKKIYECAAYILSNLDTDRDWQAALKCY